MAGGPGRLAERSSAEDSGVSEDVVDQRAVVLADWPQPATVSEPRVLADDTTLSLMYSTDGDHYAVVRFPLCTYFAFGAPNDEALGGHPLARAGLRHYSVHEVHGSALIRELERRNSVHPRHDRASYLDRRHFVFTFQDSTLECVVPAEKWWTPTVTVYGKIEEAEGAWRAKRQAEPGAAADGGA
jgi:hypothetical protein